MDKETALTILRAHKEELRAYHVKSLAIFGSVARDEATPLSNVDILVGFDPPIGYFTYFHLQERLAELLGHPVDLATPASLRETMRDEIFAEAIYA